MTEQEYVLEYIANTPGRETSQERNELFVEKWQYKIKLLIKRYTSLVDDEDDIYQHVIESWIKEDKISQYDATISNFDTYVHSYVTGHVKNWRAKRKRELDRQASLSDYDVLVDGPEPRQSFDHVVNNLNQDMHWLFMNIMRQITYYGERNTKELSRLKGVTTRAIDYQIEKLRTTLLDSGYVKIDGGGDKVWADSVY